MQVYSNLSNMRGLFATMDEHWHDRLPESPTKHCVHARANESIRKFVLWSRICIQCIRKAATLID